MDGKGRWMDNVFIERLWRSVKYEDIYLKGYGRISDLRKGLEKWFGRYKDWRPHEALGDQTPSAVYNNQSDGKARKETGGDRARLDVYIPADAFHFTAFGSILRLPLLSPKEIRPGRNLDLQKMMN